MTTVVFKGMNYDITVSAGGFDWLVQSIVGRAPGEKVSVHLDPYNIQIMNKPAYDDERAAQVK